MFLLSGFVDSSEPTLAGPTPPEWRKIAKKGKRKAAKDQVPAGEGDDDSVSEGDDGDDDDVQPCIDSHKAAFGSRPPRESVLEVACRATALMGRLCGDKMAAEAALTG